MSWADRHRSLDQALAENRHLWHPQPFREIVPAWCLGLPRLRADLLQLDDNAAEHLASDGEAALEFVARSLPALQSLADLIRVPRTAPSFSGGLGPFWDWEIPGRKRQQIEAFAAAAQRSGHPVLDWCAGKGHLGRLLALQWQVPVTSLEIDGELCREGQVLARRAGVPHAFVNADALASAESLRPEQQLVALHACGHLHRHALVAAAGQGVRALDIAPCCYYRGVESRYHPLARASTLQLARDDLRLAVTETVTASPRQRRQRDRAIAWKLGFDTWRRRHEGGYYRPFKPVKNDWLRAPFEEFCKFMAHRERLPPPSATDAQTCENEGWRRQREFLRLSILRHAFRRALEVWLVGDLALYLEGAGYQVNIGEFCSRQLTPRNLLLSAKR